MIDFFKVFIILQKEYLWIINNVLGLDLNSNSNDANNQINSNILKLYEDFLTKLIPNLAEIVKTFDLLKDDEIYLKSYINTMMHVFTVLPVKQIINSNIMVLCIDKLLTKLDGHEEILSRVNI